MQLTREQLEQLIEQARREAPRETCGIIAGKDGRALMVYPLKNVESEANVRYLADPHEQLHALQDMDEHAWDMLAIYHSHPASPAYPSPIDIARAFYPDAFYLLISLMDPAQATVRGFRIAEGEVEEVTIEIEDKDESSRTHQRRHARRAGRPHAGRPMATFSKRRPERGRARPPRGRVPKQV
ncbi:MAG: M67 family metallopeptidase [Chloroflexi bacterium]|nr:M67 family metallopeptidase [Chloroflexota bacterium]